MAKKVIGGPRISRSKAKAKPTELLPVSAVEVDRLKRAVLTIEDVMLFVKHVKIDSLASAMVAIESLLLSQSNSIGSSVVARTYQSADPNKHFLIGALPRLLLDRNLFPSNDDIVDFATSALNLDMKVEKRARFEIIGKIVCETDALDEKQLTDLVRALEKLVGDEATIADMVERKRTGSFSWNETLQELLRQ